MSKNDKKDNNILEFPSISSEEEDLLIKTIIKDSKDIKIPSSLESDNIKKLLADNNKIKKYEHKKIRKNLIAVAACAMLLVSTSIYLKTSNSQEMDNETLKSAVNSYDDVYNTLEDIDEYNEESKETGLWDFISGLFNGNIYENEKTTTSSNEAEVKEDSSANISEESQNSNSGVSEETSSDSSEDAKEYSETNNQVEGIDEGDIVKNDGSYLYCFTKDSSKYSNNNEYYDNTSEEDIYNEDSSDTNKYFGDICIVKADGEKIELTSKIQLKNVFSEFYINDNKLIVISKKYESYESYSSKYYITEDYACFDTSNKTIIDIYDIGDKTKPVLINTLSQDGCYCSSRINNGFVYLFSHYTIQTDYKKDDITTYIPSVNDTTMDASSIYIPENAYTKSFLVLTSIDLLNSDNFCSEQAIMSDCSNYYVSNNNIYVSDESRTSIKDNCGYTTISKFAYEDGKITFKKSNSVCGILNDSFSMDEYEDNLRLVTTVMYYDGSDSTNSLYILDSNLETIGSITKLAQDETIQSARFMGDYGYFVTFKNTDPLFAVDLSDPSKPTVLSKLKITGFSSYLHFYSDDLLLGIGEEIDADTLENKGIKLSMFDISDPCNITEKNKLVLDKYNNADALYEHKSVMIDTDKNLVGFCLTGYDDSYSTVINRYDYDNDEDYYVALSQAEETSYLIYYKTFSYDENKGFTTNLDINIKKDFPIDNIYSTSFRGAYINDTLYVISNAGRIVSYDLNNGKKLSSFDIY